MIDGVAFFVVLGAGAYLVCIAAGALIWPAETRTFLGKFASSSKAHYLELCTRLLIGSAFIRSAPQMRLGEVFLLFGWILTASTVVLLVLPWRWHRRFAEWSVPRATRDLRVLVAGGLAGGASIILALLLGA